MTHVNVQAVKAHLPELLDLVEQGEEIAIFRGGKTVAKLVAHSERKRNYRSIVGVWHGRVDLSGADEADKAIYRKLGMME